MFNMTKIKAVNGAGKAFYANHLAANDYYSEQEKVEGMWMGRLASKFDLMMRSVETETFSLFQRNINPETMEKLTQRTVMTGVRFFDFQCAAPKSVSILAMFDDRLVKAHDMAVLEAMRELEKLAAVRIRKGDHVRTNNLEITGKILYAAFRHDASRALDPQLHTHNVVVNLTEDSKGNCKALESVEMCRAVRYAGKVYHNALSKQCRELGYEMVNRLDEKGNITWQDIAGVSEDVMERFSKRRRQIEEEEAKFAEEHGRKPTLSENNFLSVSTSSSKMKHSNSREVREKQLNELSYEEVSGLRTLVRKSREHYGEFSEDGPELARKMLQEAMPLVFERESVVKLDKVLAEALNRNLGRISLETLKEAARGIDELRNLGGLAGNPWVSPQEVINRELFAIEAVENQRDLFDAIAPDFQAFPGEDSRIKQAELIHGMLSSKDRFNLFRGVAGAGKTSTLQELCRGLRSGGIKDIYVIAPTNSATDVLKQEGFEQSQTVASFLLSPKKPPAGSYIMIDESGLNSLREGVEIIRTAREANYRVLFVGDARQHTAVESGDFFRLLEDHSEIRRFSLTDIYRQRNEEYRRGISDCALGNFEAAFGRFDQNGFIHEDKGKYLEAAAQSYMDYTDGGRNIDQAILASPTHEEGDRLTEAVRMKLKESGSVAATGRTVEVFRSWSKPKAWIQNPANYVSGTVIGFIRNMKGIARAGEVARIQFVRNNYLYLDNGVRVYAKSAADFIEVGEMRQIELCKGDLIQFNVNLCARKIYNGNIAMITDDPTQVMMLYSDGKPRELVKLPPDYATFKYGWVTTSHKSQGRTAENVVVAAQAMDRKAFYVALSRGRKHMALHCPEKEFLKQQLNFRFGDRLSVHDLVKDGRILPLSSEAAEHKAKTLPDTTYKSIVERARKFAEYLKKAAGNLWRQGRRIASRRARHVRYGYRPVTGKMLFEVEHEHALDLVRPQRDEVPKSESRERQAEPNQVRPKNMAARNQEVQVESLRTEDIDSSRAWLSSRPVAQMESASKYNDFDDLRAWLETNNAKLTARETAEKARQEALARDAEERQTKEIQRREAVEHSRRTAEAKRAEKVRCKEEEAKRIPEQSQHKKKKARGMDL